MGTLCDNCDLNHRIEEQRDKLNNVIVEKNLNLADDEVIKLSQILDDLVYECVFCNKSIEHLLKMNLKNIYGTHSAFYYYGQQHLFVNMYYYINEGIKNNELIYIFMKKNLYEKLLSFLNINKVAIENIEFASVEQLIESNKADGLLGMQKKLNSIFASSNIQNYNGVRWIGQPAYAIELTSQKDFLDMELNLTRLIKDTNSALLCLYDVCDYMNESKVINETIIEKSLGTHSHILKKLALEGMI